MNEKYPFKFLDSYSKGDSEIFFGRDEEINALYEMIFQTDLLVVYGASGAGKTSLIQCGLANKFESHDWLALNIRKGIDLNKSLSKVLSKAGGEWKVEESESMDWLEDVMGDEKAAVQVKSTSSLERTFNSIYLRYFRPIYLIFDQFEELYLLGTKAEQQQFIESVKEILTLDQPIKMIFSIREEYLGHLFEFEKEVPELMNKKLRVEPMNQEKVKQFILGVSQYEKSNVRIQKGEEKEIATSIFEKIKGEEQTRTIHLPYLQVFLDKWYLTITGDENRRSSAVFNLSDLNNMGDIGDVLRDFLEDQVSNIKTKVSKIHGVITLENVWQILSPFATLEGTKEPISLGELYDRLPDFKHELIDDTVKEFTDSRILRYSESDDLYEITHDSLAKRIAGKRSEEDIALEEIRRLIKSQSSLAGDAKELFSEKQLNFIEPYLNKIKLSENEKSLIQESHKKVLKEQNKTKNRLRFAAFIVTIALIACGVAFWALNNAKRDRTNLGLIDYVNDLIGAKIITENGDNFTRLRSLKNDIKANDAIDNNFEVLNFLKDSSLLASYPNEDNNAQNKVINDQSINALLKMADLFKAMDASGGEQSSLLIEGARYLLDLNDSLTQSFGNDQFVQMPYLYMAMEEYHKGIKKILKGDSSVIIAGNSIISEITTNPNVEQEYAFGDEGGQVHVAGKDQISFSNVYNPNSISIVNVEQRIEDLEYSANGQELFVSDSYGIIHKFDNMNSGISDNSYRRIFRDSDGVPIIFLKSIMNGRYLIAGTKQRLDILMKTNDKYFVWSKLENQDLFKFENINKIHSTLDGKYIIAGGMNNSFILELDTVQVSLKIKEIISHRGTKINAVAVRSNFDQNGKIDEKSIALALGSELGDLWIDIDHEIQSEIVLDNVQFTYRSDHVAGISDLEFNTANPQLASSSLDGTIRLWNLEKLDDDNDHIRLEDTGQGFNCLAYINDHELVSSQNNYRRIWKTSRYSLSEDLDRTVKKLMIQQK